LKIDCPFRKSHLKDFTLPAASFSRARAGVRAQALPSWTGNLRAARAQLKPPDHSGKQILAALP
jgi:hypothetical protein